MANGNTFDEVRELIAEEKDMSVKGSQRLIMALLVDMHESGEKHRGDVVQRLEKLEDGAKNTAEWMRRYPSLLYFLHHQFWKTIGVLVLIGIGYAAIFVPDVRDRAIEIILGFLL